jgi:hypothetical protein
VVGLRICKRGVRVPAPWSEDGASEENGDGEVAIPDERAAVAAVLLGAPEAFLRPTSMFVRSPS